MKNYPWLSNYLTDFRSYLINPPNCLLMSDEQHQNANHLAKQYSKTLLCHNQQNQPCNQCQSCHLFDRKIHPDFNYFDEILKIDGVRKLIIKNTLTPQISTFKVAYLSRIDQYNDYAINALLKTLEEPSAHSIFILSAPNQRVVKSTVVSRSQHIQVPKATHQQALTFLTEEMEFTHSSAIDQLAIHQNNPFLCTQTIEKEVDDHFDSFLNFLLKKNLNFLAELDQMDKSSIIDNILNYIRHIIEIQYYRNQSLHNEKYQISIDQLSPYAITKLYANVSSLRKESVQQINLVLACKKLLVEFIQQKGIIL